MKVLHVINSLETGGAEKLLADSLPLYNNQEELDVTLLTIKQNEGFFFESLVRDGVVIHSLNISNVYNPICIFKIMPFLNKYDIIHVHLFPAQYWVGFAKLFCFSKRPLIFTEHSTSNRRWGNRLFYLFDYLSYSTYSKITCITQSVKFTFDKYMPRMVEKSVVVTNGISLETFKKAEKYELKDIHPELFYTDKLIVQVSAFRDEKDQDTVIKAMNYLPKHYKLIFVGDGRRRQICEGLATELNLENRVFFLGNRSDVSRLLKSANVAVQSSHWEGFGLAAVEAMAAGIPVVGSRVAGLADVIGTNELLFEKGNPKDLADKILQIENNTDIYIKLSNYCIERAKQFDIHKMVKANTHLYEEVLSKK